MAVQEKSIEKGVMQTSQKNLVQLYLSIFNVINERTLEFQDVWEAYSDFRIFKEMCFCVCTPQTDAHKGWLAANLLEERGLIETGSQEDIAQALRDAGVRFHKNKSRYIIQNREKFYPGIVNYIIDLFDTSNVFQIRNKLAKEVSGWGLKEASHFLRNIGFGQDITILDRHILRRLQDHGVIREIPKILKPEEYFKIEEKMKQFAENSGIPNESLDFVFWYQSKGEVFK